MAAKNQRNSKQVATSDAEKTRQRADRPTRREGKGSAAGSEVRPVGPQGLSESESPRRRLSADSRREHLLEVAQGVFISNGSAGASMREIAKTADVDAALFYRHFSSKHALFEAAIIEPLEQLIGEMVEVAARIFDIAPEDKQDSIRSGFTTLVSVMGDISPLLATALFSDREYGRGFYVTKVVPLLDAWVSAFASDLPAWTEHPIDPAVLVTGAFMMCFGFAIDAEYRSMPLDTAHLGRELTDMVTLGLSPIEAPRTTPARSSGRSVRRRVAGTKGSEGH